MSDFIPMPQGGNFHRRGGNRNHRNNNRRGRGRGGRGGRFGRGGRGRGRGRGRGGRNFHQQQNGPPDFSFDKIEEIGEPSTDSISIAVEGCCHGELDRIYARIQDHEQKTGQKIDLLICCGDFQSHRNAGDFLSSSIPPKYRSLGTFPRYYAEETKAPVLTLFIGGNHEASQPLRELYLGGWVAPNIYYLGAAGVVRYGGLRIGGISGIYKSHDYKMGQYETPPYDRSTLRSVYHVRNVDVYRMKCLQHSNERLDVMVSHDWPLGIYQHGNVNELLRKKPFFRQEVEQNALGSPANQEILWSIKPKRWFSAHLHVKFEATVVHGKETTTSSSNDDEKAKLVPSQVTQNDAAKDTQKATPKSNKESSPATDETTTFHGLESNNNCNGPDLTEQMTKFLALDKCLPRRQYLSVIHVVPPDTSGSEDGAASPTSRQLEYDPEWLAIVRKTNHLTCTVRRPVSIPPEQLEVSTEETNWVKERIVERNGGNLAVPNNFCRTVPIYSHPMFHGRCRPFPAMGNPQTDNLLSILDLEHSITVPYDPNVMGPLFHTGDVADENEIEIDDVSDGAPDENEIDIDELSDDNDDSARTGPKDEDENEIDIDDMSDENGDGGDKEPVDAAKDTTADATKGDAKDADGDENEIALSPQEEGDESSGKSTSSPLVKKSRYGE